MEADALEVRSPLRGAPRRRTQGAALPVLGVVYLVFNEGYAATAGEDWMRPALRLDALRLGRVLAGLMPGEPEVLGLVAPMEIQGARLKARPGPREVRLFEQDRNRSRGFLIRALPLVPQGLTTQLVHMVHTVHMVQKKRS